MAKWHQENLKTVTTQIPTNQPVQHANVRPKKSKRPERPLKPQWQENWPASAREKAEKERADINKMMRDTERQYKGPLLFSDEVREEERKRQISLRKKFNKADARWTQIKEEAELKFYAWANVELESMIQVKTEDLDLELANLDVARFELEDKIAERESILESLRIIRKAGYGN